MPERLMPANSAPICATPTATGFLEVERVEAPALLATRCARCGCVATSFVDRGARRTQSPTSRISAVDREEDRGGERLREQGAQRVLEREAGEAGRDRRDDEQPRHALVGRLERPRPQRAGRTPPMIRTQSARKYTSSASAVATCSATTNARYGDSLGRLPVTTSSQPSHAGMSTEWPRLEIGNSSVTPCSTPITIAWK